jgi:very-short-patch-repair endonuclease
MAVGECAAGLGPRRRLLWVMGWGTLEPMNNPQRLKWAFDQARRDLIDLTRRNHLLHAPLTGKRPWCLEIVGQSPDELFDRLHRQESFHGYAFNPREADADDSETHRIPRSFQINGSKASPPRRPKLQTKIPPDKLEKRLAKIFREERTLEEEQGLSTLYLALGFLKWFDSDQSEDESFAPLLLLPVTMARVKGGDGYLVRGRDAEIEDNTSLREKLRSNFDIQLPHTPEDEQWRPSDYYNDVAREIGRQQRWEVNREAVGLGFFTFSKFMMWRDLDAASWPNDSLMDHPLLNVLLDADAEFESATPLAAEDEPIDRYIDISKCIHVVDADSSQAVVIEEARVGRNLVVQGPPGTGKSQTITNIIASAVHNDKKVLFVAEKTAALEVVYERLRKAGLDALCLEMHSRKANKGEVFKSLKQSLGFSSRSQISESSHTQLAICRDKLNDWSTAIHRPIGETGRTVFDVVGRQVKLRNDGVRLLDCHLVDVATWSANKLSLAETAVDRTAEAVSRIAVIPKDHAWFGTDIEAQSPFDLERLTPRLSAALKALTELSAELKDIFPFIADDRSPSIADAFATVKALRHLAAAPGESRSILGNRAWVSDLAALETAIESGQRFTATVSHIDRHFNTNAWTCDAGTLLATLSTDGRSFFRRFGGRYRKAIAEFRAISRGKPPKSLDDRIVLLESLKAAQDSRNEFRKKVPLLSCALGPIWAEHKTPWTEVLLLVGWTRFALSELGGTRLLTIAARTQKDLHVFSAFAGKLEAASKTARMALNDLQKIVRADFRPISGHESHEYVPISDLSRRISTWRENVDAINDWVSARKLLTHLKEEGLGVIAEKLMDGSVQAKEARSITDLLIAESLWRRATSETPDLKFLEGDDRTQCVNEFRELDQQRIRTARQEVLERYVDHRPNGYAGEMGIVRAETEKKRGHRAIRKLMLDAGSAVQRLKPIFLMSPLSVAQFLPPGRVTFDLVVIDGVFARAKQVVVVGDDKQLPPTNFFKTVSAGDDEEKEEEIDKDSEQQVRQDRPTDFESILTLSRTRGMSERMLGWHYRSRHPSLIALSNEECYAGRLLLPPSPFVQTDDFGLSLSQTPRGHYDRGGTRCDLVQAEEVAKAVAQQIRRHPNKSLGIACLSVQQRNAVDDMIDKLSIRPDVEGFSPKGERLFVKNLEAVQGDERDVIFISVGYGVAPNQSKPFLNFGPVSRDGGERRLNVLASRARERCVIYSSITAADIPADNEIRGTRMLRALLHFAETGKLSAGTLGNGDFESPFEEAVARVIREAGFNVHPQVGVKGFRIDLGVVDPAKPGEFILGVECDGSTYHSARSARDRDRLRQEVLEGLGWRLHRIWSTDWFHKPQRESSRLFSAIAEAKSKGGHPTAELLDDELLESETQDAAEETTLSNGPDEPDIPSSAVEYKECALTIPVRRELLELSVLEVSRLALVVVEAEGPIHADEVARRIREAFGLQKTGKRILGHVRAGLIQLSRSGNAVKDGEFWSASGHTIQFVRDRRKAALPLRRAAMIAPTEYQLALSTVISDAVAISREDLIVETARLFGFDRTGPDLRDAIDRQAARMLKLQRLHLDGNLLRLPEVQVPIT